MNGLDQKIISYIYTKKEGYYNVINWFKELKSKGLNPAYITMDGEISVTRAIRSVWPKVKIQRCLWHIKREGMRWLRTNPKTQAGKDLKFLLYKLSFVKSLSERDLFINSFNSWLLKHKDFLKLLPKDIVAFKDLKRTITLIKNAIPDMFYHLEDSKVHSTTNALEGFHSRLKADYRRHRGLTINNRIKYLGWYCYFQNGSKTNIL